mmetsp:Transcript_16485/g.35825  ORF Transcript_16485/g.35825 Transcript_16485/m.35825 type:complete len:306 (+) Transcript_16485:1086-2003(+)
MTRRTIGWIRSRRGRRGREPVCEHILGRADGRREASLVVIAISGGEAARARLALQAVIGYVRKPRPTEVDVVLRILVPRRARSRTAPGVDRMRRRDDAPLLRRRPLSNLANHLGHVAPGPVVPHSNLAVSIQLGVAVAPRGAGLSHLIESSTPGTRPASLLGGTPRPVRGAFPAVHSHARILSVAELARSAVAVGAASTDVVVVVAVVRCRCRRWAGDGRDRYNRPRRGFRRRERSSNRWIGFALYEDSRGCRRWSRGLEPRARSVGKARLTRRTIRVEAGRTGSGHVARVAHQIKRPAAVIRRA